MATRQPARASVARRPIPSAVRLVVGLALLVLVGTLLLMLPITATGEPLPWNVALFTATSALSVTGLATIIPARDLTIVGQMLLLLLIQVGGVGFMVVAVVLLRLFGRRVGLTDRIALSDSLGLLSPAAIVQLTGRVLLTVLTIEGVGALLLYLHWRTDPRLSEGQALFYAIFHAVSAFCNAGFDLFTGTPGYPDGIPRDGATLAVFGGLIFLGGLGIPVVAELLAFARVRRFSLHTRLTLLVVALLVTGGALGFFLAEGRPGGTLEGEPPVGRLMISLFQSISARTAGFAGIATLDELTPASQLLMMALMFIGCAPASMGGGITTGTFAALALSLWSFVRGDQHARFGGRELARGTVQRAAAVLSVSLTVVLLATWLLLLTHDATLDEAAFEVVSAFATCGLTLGFTSELNLFGQLLICLVMFWGRLGALTIVVALTRQPRPHPVHYPEEQILIG